MPDEQSKRVRELSIKHARRYLLYGLGGRRGCRVLANIDKEDEDEIITECAIAMEKFATAFLNQCG